MNGVGVHHRRGQHNGPWTAVFRTHTQNLLGTEEGKDGFAGRC